MPHDPLILSALKAARDTRACAIDRNLLPTTPSLFRQFFPTRPAALIADPNSWQAAGERVLNAFHQSKHPTTPHPFLFTSPDLYAEMSFVDELRPLLDSHPDAIPIAIGSGTINDLVKLAAHRANRPYIAIATAASMDGYTAFGASITHHGSKQTFDCPAPIAVLADLDVIATAPYPLNPSGYADLLAKLTAGADWLLADALQIEPLDQTAWSLVQTPIALPTGCGTSVPLSSDAACGTSVPLTPPVPPDHPLANPHGIPAKDPAALRSLTTGLMMGGFAMQWTKSSRPASGAEHQFSHLWDMQHHTHPGPFPPTHGFKVAIGTLAIAHAYDHLLTLPLDHLDIDQAVNAYPTQDQLDTTIFELLGRGELADKAHEETRAKHVTPQQLHAQLTLLKQSWPTLKQKLRTHLPPAQTLAKMLHAAGAPTEPEQIGITRERLRTSFKQAHLIRRRFTLLDLLARTHLFDPVLNHLFSPQGPWPL